MNICARFIRNLHLTPFIGILLFCGTSFAQPFPSKPIRFIVSFPPGGSADLVARGIAPRMAEKLGQPVVVENRPGAGGNIGVDAVAKSAPDGHTIGLAAAGALSVNASLYPSMPFNPEKDLAPITSLAMIPFFIIAHPSQPATLKEALQKASTYGHGGNGSAMHLSGELLKQMTRANLQAVPYKGSAPVAADVLGGQVPLGVVDVPSALANVRAGKLRALAVTTSRRIKAAPEVPTVAEAGVAGYEAIGWFGAVAPAGTPMEIIKRLNSEIVTALGTPELQERMLAAGAEPLTNSPEEFAAMIREETRKWNQVIRTAGVKLE
ncbi:MAG TPA: tripartite tricarboxylate transporter substrate binding protein [Burkholderiales bacterium]|nr:tripartite tricarboxylate transporter substrate binding protein [Burkholderiales bacterium]